MTASDDFGVFGFSYLEENRDKIQGAKIDGVEPERDLISSGEYPVSRSLFFYTKNAHVGRIDGMGLYLELMKKGRDVSQFGDDLLSPAFGYGRLVVPVVLPQFGATTH